MIVNIYGNFSNQGGAQDVVIQLAHALNPDCKKPPVMTRTKPSDIIHNYANQADYFSFSLKNILSFHWKGCLFLSHDRKLTTWLVLLNILFLGRMRIVHVAHNVFHTLKHFTLYPAHIIAISTGVKENLIEYFHVSPKKIHLIYNGIPDLSRQVPSHKRDGQKRIRILWAGRISPVKQQVRFVRMYKGRIPDHVQICFAGKGDELDMLQQEIQGDDHFQYCGFIPKTEIADFDYVILLSKNEGMPLILIEAECLGKPLITNNLRSVLDVNVPGETGFVCPSFEGVQDVLKQLPYPDDEHYIRYSRNCRRRYEELFSEQKMIESYKVFLGML